MKGRMNQHSLYYQAHISKPETLGCVSILKSFDHVCFDRTLDASTGLFEFFVPESQEPFFLKLMHYFEKERVVKDIKRLPNRIEAGEAIIG
jgi:hypothetical protein